MTAATTADAALHRGAFLRRLNPLSKVAAALPGGVALLFAHDLCRSLALAAFAAALLLAGAGLRPRRAAVLLLALVAGTALTALGFAFWTDPAAGLTLETLRRGVSTAARIAALVMLAMIGGLTTGGFELARALTAQLRVPYRFAYAAVAAARFVPRSSAEAKRIRAAQRIRGIAPGRGPVDSVHRAAAMVVPLLASSIRHADRVALAMDSRAFGAHPARTERNPPLWRSRDTVFVGSCWAVTVLALLLL